MVRCHVGKMRRIARNNALGAFAPRECSVQRIINTAAHHAPLLCFQKWWLWRGFKFEPRRVER